AQQRLRGKRDKRLGRLPRGVGELGGVEALRVGRERKGGPGGGVAGGAGSGGNHEPPLGGPNGLAGPVPPGCVLPGLFSLTSLSRANQAEYRSVRSLSLLSMSLRWTSSLPVGDMI